MTGRAFAAALSILVVILASPHAIGNGSEPQAKIWRMTPAGDYTAYQLPAGSGSFTTITAAPDGTIWIWLQSKNRIRRLSPTGGFVDYSFGNRTPPRMNSRDFALAPDGALWIEGSTGTTLLHITASGGLAEYTIPRANSRKSMPYGIHSVTIHGMTIGPDGALWFTEGRGGYGEDGRIGRVTAAGAFIEYKPPFDYMAGSIVGGPDGALWFTEPAPGTISRVTTSGVFSHFQIPTPRLTPIQIRAGPDGAMWLTAGVDSAHPPTGKVIRVTRSGAFTVYTLPTANAQASCIMSGRDALWLTESIPATRSQKVVRLSTSGRFTEYTAPPGSSYLCIAADRAGTLWLY